ncbi:hypothetical protein FB565_002226 [Actinoplanes lutulentus]|uniref:Immunity protein 21 of polymorphic toxin system n=1 Tax=Actinoplanes lutulentus TaxID=1287878 RepID=A0A327ZEH3_9ACTN|nr:Imm21 family immunity protein [Actinoplanes lutulentus]MBB2942513.1 hypothetical protein [Actinoplanes lutulentus]RAK38094.1 immunity protein 21 of polymorphic toxin system [Actinoplanes lutulentus]
MLITSLGGPLIAIGESVVSSWLGLELPFGATPPSGAAPKAGGADQGGSADVGGGADMSDGVNEGDGVDESGDEWEAAYQRACAISGEAGILPIGTAQALVIRAGGLPTGYLPGHHLIFQREARNAVIDPRRDALAAAGLARWRPAGVIRVDEPLRLFDAVFSGDYAMTRAHLLIDDLTPGDWVIETARADPAPDVRFTLIRLTSPAAETRPVAEPRSGAELWPGDE